MIARSAALACLLALSGCEMAAYYLQAMHGHLDLVGRAQPVERLLADPATPGELRSGLELASRMRDFASRELKLPDNASFRGYADLGRPYAVWNVVAAPEFDLKPVLSCFPIAGCVTYRGFYAREDALRHAARLREAGHDVFAYGVAAYSTLGWFDDPLLSTFIGYPEAELARLVFHELAHQVVYVRGDTTFNESFAMAVEREGVKRWLRAAGRDAELGVLALREQRTQDFHGLLARARQRLEAVYGAAAAPEAMRPRKAEAFKALREEYEALKRERWAGFAGYDRFFTESGPNNAMLAAFATYSQLVEGFERVLAAEGGDLERFYARVKALAALERDARERALGR